MASRAYNQFASSEGVSDTGVVTPTQTSKLLMNFTTPEAGDYEIRWYAEHTVTNSTSYEVITRTFVDGSEVGESFYDPEDSGYYQRCSGRIVKTLSAGAHTAELTFCLNGSFFGITNAAIRRARFFVERLK